MKTHEFHEAANLFPLDEDHIDELAADIKANGQQVPVELLGDRIIDGRRRYTACGRVGIIPQFRSVETADPVAYVLSINLHRRQLTPSQRAMVAAKAREIYDRQADERMRAGKKNPVASLPQGESGKSRDMAGKAAGVSGKSVDYATKVLKQAEPEVVKAVVQGRMAVSTAAILATEPPEVQRQEAANPKRNRTYNSVSSPTSPPNAAADCDTPAEATRTVKGVGVIHANEAINCLIRIPKNDALRKRGFQVVTDWIKHNS